MTEKRKRRKTRGLYKHWRGERTVKEEEKRRKVVEGLGKERNKNDY